jgi:hypothetical protein
MCNVFIALGVVVPPYATLSVLWERQAKHQRPSKDELLRKYESDYAKVADTMIHQLRAFVEKGAAARRD